MLLKMPLTKVIPIPFTPDEAQRQAIEHVHGPMLVIAGAGTGKTTVLTRRIAQLIESGNAKPAEILALTYTDNAVREMRERVQKELASDCRIQAMTFHAYCFRVLDRCGKKFGILDDKDIWIYLRKRIRELRLNYFVRAANVAKFLDDLLDFMRRCQDELVGPDRYADYVRRLERGELPLPRVAKPKDDLSDEELLGRCAEIASVYATVEQMLEQENLGTFGHMITRAHELLATDPGLLSTEQAGARFVLVDEFQDANFAQVKILHKLAGAAQNVFAVGDPDQAIYRFRGASSAAFGLFKLHFPQGKLVTLEKNQRSLAPILRCAYSLIAHNPPALNASTNGTLSYQRRPLVSARGQSSPAPAEPIQAILWRDRELEAADVVGAIRQKQRKSKCSWDKFAVIYRIHYHREEVVEELARRGIPYCIEGLDVLDTPEVRDLMACLGAVVSPRDSASLFRVAALPQFSIDPEKLRAAMKAAGREVPLSEVLDKVEGGSAVLASLKTAREQVSGGKARGAIEILVRAFALPAASPAIAAVFDFVKAWENKPTTETGSAAELLEYLELFRQAHGSITMATQEENAVRLMTAHAAKGLEFDHVFIIRAMSPCFPGSYREPLFEFPRELRDETSLADQDSKQLYDEEERRLFYVAVTRARDSLAMYGKQGNGKDATPPGFVRELLKDRTISDCLTRRHARPLQVDLFAEEAVQQMPATNVTAWLQAAPAFRLSTILSATAVELYERCPLQFKLEREWRIPGEVPAAMQYGASVHRALRSYCDSVRFERVMTDEALVDFFRNDLEKAKIEDSYQHELYRTQGEQQLREFVGNWKRTEPQPIVLETEKEFNIRIGEATVAGRIDRIDGGRDSRVVIIDYKTGKPRSQEDADESLQLSIYAIAAREKWNYEAERLVFYNLENNSAVSTTRSDMQLAEAKAKVEDVAEKVAAGKFDPNPGFYCGFCSYRNLCPATEKRIHPIEASKKAAGSRAQ